MTTPLTMVGNLTADPTTRNIESGDTVTTLRIASNSRYFDPTTSEWRDGNTLFLTATCWRALAINVATSLRKGDRVVITGRLKQRDFETDGVKRSVIEIEADAVGPDLSRVSVNLQRAIRAAAAVAEMEESPVDGQHGMTAPPVGVSAG